MVAMISVPLRRNAMPHAVARDGTRLYYEEAGSGTPVISSTSSPATIAAGSRRCASSRATSAASPTTRAAFRPPTCRRTAPLFAGRMRATTSIAVLDHLKLERAHVVGLSMGGFADAACRHRLPAARAARSSSPAAAMAPNPTSSEKFQRRMRSRRRVVRGELGATRRRNTRSARRACSSRTRTRAAGRNSRSSSPSIRPRARRSPCAACR